MLKTYERLLARELYSATLLVWLAFLALFAFFDLLRELEDLGKGGYQLQHALLYVSLTLPGRSYEILPIAVLIGSLYALTLLARHSEITVLRASGLSTGALLFTLGKLGAVFVGLTFVIGEFIAPPAEQAAQQLRVREMHTVVAQEFRSGLWVKDEMSFINVREVLPDATLLGVRIYEFDSSWRLRAISEAKQGRFDAGVWRLSDVTQTRFQDERAQVSHLADLEWRSAMDPALIAVSMVVPERLSLLSLWRYIRHLSDNQQKTSRYEIALWKKLVYPLATLVMMALALPFAYRHDRTSAVSVKVFAGVMLGIAFYMLNGLFAHLGLINVWPPMIAALTPSAAFFLAAGAMLFWVEKH